MKTQLFFIISAICLLACSPHTSPSTETNAQCTNLHQVSDIDDLLSQIYSNIDSSCLFDMPTAELEKIWSVRIIDVDNKDSLSKQNHAENNTHCTTRTDGLFLLVSKANQQIDFQISQCYQMKFGGLHTDEHLFKYINKHHLQKQEIQTILNIPAESLSASNTHLAKYHTVEYGYRYIHPSPYSQKQILIEHSTPIFPTQISIR